MNIKYFDHAGTTPIKEEVVQEMFPYLTREFGNPSSLYSIGRKAKRAIEDARKKVANLIGANANEIYFTGCGSESDNTAIKGIAFLNKEKGNHIITSKIEHHAILDSCKFLEKQGFEITYLNVDKEGKINISELENSINKSTILISIMTANNEIGTIQPIEEISKIAKIHNITFHTDSVQAVGNIPIDVQKMGIDMLSMSAHKIYGPKGVGALYVKDGIEFEKFINGGHQEKNKRSGTENVAGIVGFGKACELARKNLDKYQEHLKNLRDYYIKQIQEKVQHTKLNGHPIDRLPGNANISFKGIEGETLLLKLDLQGICASSGSACNSGSNNPSHVLTAIGLEEEFAKGALRVTFGESNTKEDIDFLIDKIVETIEELGTNY